MSYRARLGAILAVCSLLPLLAGCSSASSWQGSAYESLKTQDAMAHPTIGTPNPQPPPNQNYPAYDSQRQQLLQGNDSR